MEYPKYWEQWAFMGERCYVRYFYEIVYTGVLVVRRVHKLLPFKRKMETNKKITVIAVPAIITGFGYGYNGVRKVFDGVAELRNKKRINYIFVRLRPNGKEYKVPAKHCFMKMTNKGE